MHQVGERQVTFDKLVDHILANVRLLAHRESLSENLERSKND